MKPLLYLAVVLCVVSQSSAQVVKKDIPYVQPADPRQALDIYAPAGAKDLPVVFWIHGGGWQGGDKGDMKLKPQAFMDKGFVFVSTNYRLLPAVDMATLIGDVAQSFRWMHDHIAEYGGNPNRVLVAGHSAGAQLAAILCTNERFLGAQGLGFDSLIGCIPLDGDTYDVPAIVETEETRLRTHHLPPLKFGHRQEFGDSPESFRDFSAAYHVAKGKGVPPFLLLYITANPDTAAQARHLGDVLKEAGISATVFGARETSHNQLNDRLGLPDDPATKALYQFMANGLRK